METVNSDSKITVIMSVFNDQAFLEASLDSIFDQCLDFELVVIDDCSTDQTPNILARYQDLYDCFIVIRNKSNLGLAASLNKALQHANGELIARMDADDICHPERLRVQQAFLLANPDVDIVGGNAQLIKRDGTPLKVTNLPLSHDDILVAVDRINPMIHPAVMYRRSFVDRLGGYDERLRRCQDYDLWLRGIDSSVFANLPGTLIDYRVSSSSSLENDIYSCYVRLINSWRRKSFFKAPFWAFAVLGVNLIKKIGYVQRNHRS